MRKNKKASLIGSPFIILLTFILIVVSFLIFFSFFNYEKNYKALVIEKAEGEIGDTTFLLGILRAESSYKDMNIAQVISYYEASEDSALYNLIKKDIEEIMMQLFAQDICWKLKIENLEIERTTSCINIPTDKINAELILPSYNQGTITVRFDTP